MALVTAPDVAPIEHLHVLLVEDNPGDVLLISEALREASIDATRATTLDEAIGHLDAGGIDAVLLDLGLPDSQALDTLAAILRATRKPVIVLTGLADETVGLEAVRRGAEDFLVKGRVDDDGLVRAVRFGIERSRLREAVASPLLETAPVGLAVLDRELRFLYANPALAEITGIAAALHLGREAGELIPQLGNLETGLLCEVIRSGGPLRDVEIAVQGDERDGRGRTILVSAEPMRTSDGSVVGVTLSIADISERKRKEEALASLAESRSQTQAIGESIPFGIWIADPDGGVRYLSESFLRLVGMTLGEAASDGWIAAVVPEERSWLREQWQACVASGASWECEYRVRGTDGRTHTLLSRGYPVRTEGDEVTSWAGINLDITDRRDAEVFRQALVGVLSHELRTPITTIYGSVRILLRPDLAAETQGELLRDIETESERLRRLIDDLLILAKAEQGPVEFGEEPVLLHHVLPRVAADVRRRWPAIEVTVEANDLPLAAGNEAMIEQVVYNLLTNAAKYAGDHGPIRVVARKDGECVAVRIIDQGPGFDAEEAARLFELFYRSEATSHISAGSGIGLFVVRRLVESMQGDVWAVPRRDGQDGAEFGFRLPATSAEG